MGITDNENNPDVSKEAINEGKIITSLGQINRICYPEYATMSLEEFSNHLAELMDKSSPKDIKAHVSIYNTINAFCYDDGSEDIQRFHIVSVCADHGNLLAMMELADSYRDTEFPQESEPEYFSWLQKIIEDERVKEYCNYLKNKISLEGFDDESKVQINYTTGKTYFELGVLYKNSEDLNELRRAYEYLDIARACGYPFYPDPNITVRLLNELGERIKTFERQENNQKIEQEQIELIKDISINNQDVNTQINIIKERLIEEVGIEVWENFTNQTRSCLLTAVSCLYYLNHVTGKIGNELDYSSVIVPLMKCLEYELRIRFYNRYIKFLKQRYPINEFIYINGLEQKPIGTKTRGCILYQGKDGTFDYNDPIRYPNQFTLGKFAYVIGFLNSRNRNLSEPEHVDPTLLDYCRTKLFRKSDSTEQEIESWLYELALQIEGKDGLSDMRNTSAHGGSVKHFSSAKTALEDLVLLKKILVDLVQTCR